MKIIDNLGDFIEKVESVKKTNQLDVSGDEDLSVALMNLISIEEHLFFTGAKTQNNHFYDLIEEIRECRKELLKKIIKAYKGEVWCISKHLLAGCMRLMEVGTKLLHSEKREEAYDCFGKAYDLYCLFWGLNLNAFDEETTRDLISHVDGDTATRLANDRSDDSASAGSVGSIEPAEPASRKIASGGAPRENPGGKRTGLGAKLRNFVTNAINCCRE